MVGPSSHTAYVDREREVCEHPAMSLPGFTEWSFTHDGVTRVVYRRGEGPGVVVMPEISGISPS
jgi:hypothetical protein